MKTPAYEQALQDMRLRFWGCAHAMQRATEQNKPERQLAELKTAEFFWSGFKARRREALALAPDSALDHVGQAIDELPALESPKTMIIRVMTGEAA
ncbi:hypothetical protein [Thalassolituus sp.]|uniref:hypothetical protein n=1 Tax=Thalassolituus sp. TaxID=2030822 RepID=UPI00261D26B1|nr:hypothetical protein [Thalassolituus sp.]